jgi:hypothetical protein
LSLSCSGSNELKNVCHTTKEATGQQAFAKLATRKPFEMGKFKQILFEEC